MPSRTSQIAQVGKRKLELSNLTKLLFPDDHIVKAQLIEYYFKIAPTILAHVKGRPLSLVRYPDGIGVESFFQKNRPDWAPDWIEHVTLGEEKKDYVITTEEASLVWRANLACIELHQMHSRAPHFDKPDYIAYDFDPPENFKFTQMAELALEFKKHLEGFGYHPFVKTTGRKGLHDFRLAQVHYEMAGEVDPSFANVYFNLALVQAIKNDFGAAISALTKYQELVSEDEARNADELLHNLKKSLAAAKNSRFGST